jgi:hypothetical protein
MLLIIHTKLSTECSSLRLQAVKTCTHCTSPDLVPVTAYIGVGLEDFILFILCTVIN